MRARRLPWLGRLHQASRGTLLLETVVAVGILTVLGTTLLGAIQTSYVAKRQFEVRATAEQLIRNEMEYIYDQPYQAPGGDYLTISAPAGYSVVAEALTYDAASPNISTVRISVHHHGQLVRAFETLRANR